MKKIFSFNLCWLLMVLPVLVFTPLPAAAQIFTPVSITSITCSSGTCTVTTSAAHDIPTNEPGFCILGSSQSADNICGTAVTVPSSTTYTFALSTGVACSSSCGTSQPAPVMMLKGSTPSLGQLNVSACMYTFVTSGVTVSGATSQCAGQFSATLAGEINTALASGLWIEYDENIPFSNSTTLATVEQHFQALQLSYQLQQLAPGGFTGHECDNTGCN